MAIAFYPAELTLWLCNYYVFKSNIAETMDQMAQPTEQDVKGEEHWTKKDGSINIFMWNKYVGNPGDSKGTIIFVHGSSMA